MCTSVTFICKKITSDYFLRKQSDNRLTSVCKNQVKNRETNLNVLRNFDYRLLLKFKCLSGKILDIRQQNKNASSNPVDGEITLAVLIVT